MLVYPQSLFQMNLNRLEDDWEDIISPYAEDYGCEVFGAIGKYPNVLSIMLTAFFE